MLTIYPNEILFKKSEDVTLEEGLEVAQLLKDEIKTLYWGHCVGLAAPQIGINKKVFIALDIIYINPKITWYSEVKFTDKEGCYSLERHNKYPVERSESIRMEWTNKKGEQKVAMFSKFQAQVLQHEYDHLEGKLCCGDKVPTEDEIKNSKMQLPKFPLIAQYRASKHAVRHITIPHEELSDFIYKLLTDWSISYKFLNMGFYDGEKHWHEFEWKVWYEENK